MNFAPRNSLVRAAMIAGCLAIATAALCGPLARATDAPYVSYPLRHARAAEVEPTLQGLLGKNAAGTQVVVDVRGNQLLVSAPPDVHRMVAELVRKLDQPARQPAAPTQDAAPRDLAETAPADRYVRRSIPLAHSKPAQVESLIQDLLGSKLQARPGRGAGLNAYELTTARGARVEIEFDIARNQVMTRGPERTVNELAELVATLDEARLPSDRTVRVVPLGKADRAKLRQAIDAYRGGGPAQGTPGGPPASAPRVEAPHGAPSSQLNRVPPRRTIPGVKAQGMIDRATGRSVRHLLMQDPGRAIQLEEPIVPRAEQPAVIVEPGAQPTIVVPAPPSEAAREAAEQASADRLRELGTVVDVEALADLDVIILRGSERDVNELMRIIQEIERISAESVPQVEIIPLQHVSSESLATIIKQIQVELLAGRQGRASAVSLVRPNALMLIGWGESLAAMTELVGKLDQPVGPETQLRVFRLKHAGAAAARATIQEFFKERTGLASKVTVVADARSNSLIVQAGPRDLAEVELLIARLDTQQSSAVNQLRVFRLNNSLAADLAPVIEEAINASAGSKAGAAAAAAGANAERSAALEFLTVDTRGQQLIKSGVLADVRITPDPRTNTLLVSAPAESMELLAALIRQLDDQPAAVAQVKVFRIVNGDATRLVEMLRSLLGTQTAAGPLAPALAGAEGESSLAPMRFSVDVRTNSIIASGSAGDLTIVEAILLRLDESDAQFRKNAIYRLKNAFAPDVAQAINEFLRSERRVQLAAPGGVSIYRQIESEVVVVPEIVSNSLILSATPRYFDEIRDLIEDLDAQPPQVMIQVLIAEVALNNVDEFGIELGLQDSVLFDRSLLGSLVTTTESIQTSTPAGIITNTNQIIQGATNEPGFDFNSPILPNSGSDRSLSTAGIVGGQGLSSFGVGRVNSELGYGGLVLSASSENVSLLVRALRECRRLDVLSRPQVMTLDNQPAFIQVGQRVPRITNVNITQFGQNSAVELFNVGLILGVTPRISPDGMVVMEVDAEKSAIGPVAEGIPVSFAPNGDAILSPRVDVTTAQTTVSAADGQTIVLGGLITRSQRTVNRRVPYLSSIPVLGFLFRYDQFIGQRTELIIILTPHVVRTEADAERIKQLESARMSWCLGDAEKLQGDMGIHPRGSCEHCDVETKVIYPDNDPRGVNPTIIDPDLPTGPELVPPGVVPPMPGEMPSGSVDQGAPPPGPQSVVTPVTKLARPTPLPPVAQADPRSNRGANRAMHLAPRIPLPQRGGPLQAPPSAVRPAAHRAPAPSPPASRTVVTGNHPAGSVIPGGASEYLRKPVEKK